MGAQWLNRRSLAFPLLGSIGLGVSGCGYRGGAPLAGSPEADAARVLARPDYRAVYAAYPGERFPLPAVDFRNIDPKFLRQVVEIPAATPVGSIIVDPDSYHLYFVESPGRATRYGVGVGREGFGWSGTAHINMKRDWPDWVPPREMIERDPDIRRQLEPTPRGLGVRGGARSPLGARAMYLFGDGRDLGYRIHGTLEPETVGSRVSSGCIRMINQDIAHLYTRSALGTAATVLQSQNA